eukprot:scaffold8402_cov468-Pinguiococcus_pyrenoidosus.AAC.1
MTAFVADVGYDIDLDNDDVADNTQAFVGVLDAVQVPDTTGEPLYGSQLGGVDLPFVGDEPTLVFRDG